MTDEPADVGDPEFAAIIDYVRLNPGDPLGLLQEEWRCMVCGRRRRYGQISVAHVAPQPRFQVNNSMWNVSYCNDQASCTAVATGISVWPPAAAVDWCIPGLDLHTTPHRGCVLR